jgi:hypothetical protein
MIFMITVKSLSSNFYFSKPFYMMWFSLTTDTRKLFIHHILYK